MGSSTSSIPVPVLQAKLFPSTFDPPRPPGPDSRDWTDDAWSGGAYSDLVMDLSAYDTEDVLRAGDGPIQFASSELSPSFPGYVEGAIIAGRLAASKLLAALNR